MLWRAKGSGSIDLSIRIILEVSTTYHPLKSVSFKNRNQFLRETQEDSKDVAVLPRLWTLTSVFDLLPLVQPASASCFGSGN